MNTTERNLMIAIIISIIIIFLIIIKILLDIIRNSKSIKSTRPISVNINKNKEEEEPPLKGLPINIPTRGKHIMYK